MIAPEHLHHKLLDFSRQWQSPQFDTVNLFKTLNELTPADLNWCLRKRQYLHQVIDIVLDRIRENWSLIDQYYPTEICEWYDDAMKEIISLPFTFWNCRHQTFEELRSYLRQSVKREIPIEKRYQELFLTYQPVEVTWSLADSEDCISSLDYGLGMEVLGNILYAEEMLKYLKYALLHSQPVHIESTGIIIRTEDELYAFIRQEYADYNSYMDDLVKNIGYEKRVNINRGV